MKEPLTISESQSVVKDLRAELDKVKQDIKSKGAVDAGIDFLSQKQDILQSKINDLLKKGGIITEEDYNESYQIIRSKQENELKNLYKKANKRLFMFLGLGLAIVVGYLIITKKK